MTPSGSRGVLNDAVAIVFSDAPPASAFVARWKVTAKVETAGGVCWVREGKTEPPAAPSTVTSSRNFLTASAPATPTSVSPAGIVPGYLCSLGTNTVPGNSTNGLFGVVLDDGPEN